MSQHYYADGAKHYDRHREMNINISGGASDEQLLKIAKGFFADDEGDEAEFVEVKEENVCEEAIIVEEKVDDGEQVRKKESIQKAVQEIVEGLYAYANPQWKDNFIKLWNEILADKTIAMRLLEKNPRTFDGGYNQKLVCNIVGILKIAGVINATGEALNRVLDNSKDVKKYIFDNRDVGGGLSVISDDMNSTIGKIISKYKPKEKRKTMPKRR